jgi:HSP20 family protein
MEVTIMNMVLRDHFFDSFFNNFGVYERDTSHYEVVENEGSFDLHVELPGIKKGHLSLKVHENHLSIKADNTVESDSNEKLTRLNKRYEKTFKLPVSVDQDKISSTLEDGILSVKLPKYKEQKPKNIDIQVK